MIIVKTLANTLLLIGTYIIVLAAVRILQELLNPGHEHLNSGDEL